MSHPNASACPSNHPSPQSSRVISTSSRTCRSLTLTTWSTSRAICPISPAQMYQKACGAASCVDRHAPALWEARTRRVLEALETPALIMVSSTREITQRPLPPSLHLGTAQKTTTTTTTMYQDLLCLPPSRPPPLLQIVTIAMLFQLPPPTGAAMPASQPRTRGYALSAMLTFGSSLRQDLRSSGARGARIFGHGPRSVTRAWPPSVDGVGNVSGRSTPCRRRRRRRLATWSRHNKDSIISRLWTARELVEFLPKH